MKRVLSFVLVIMMLVTLMPFSAFADNDISIITQPASQTVTEGDDAVFTVVATMKGMFNDQNIAYFWYDSSLVSLDGQTTGAAILLLADKALGVGPTLTLENVSADMDGMRIRCAVYHIGDVRTHAVITDAATLSVALRDPCEEHTLIYTEEKAPTCSAEGNIEYWQCDFCHRLYANSEATIEITRDDIVVPVDPYAHEMKHIDRVDASCIRSGNIEYWQCELCGNSYSNPQGEGEALTLSQIVLSSSSAAHQRTLVPYKAPTCSEEGNIEYYVCDVCGNYYRADGSRIPKKGNVALSKINHTPAYDYDESSHWQYCTMCGIEIANSRAAHNDNVRKATCVDKAICECGAVHGSYGGHLYNAVITKPTCTADGYTTYTCKNCNHSYVDNRTDKLGHSYGAWKVTKAATCTEDGVETRYCSRGDATEARAITESGHSYVKSVIAATCTEDGYTTYSCKKCGDSYTTDRTDKRGHSFGDWEVYKAATCTEDGTSIRYCSRCNASETCVTEAIGHYYIKSVIAPTCTADGCTAYTCKNCGDRYTTDRTEKLGHSFGAWQVTKAVSCTENGIETRYCSRCDATETCEVEAPGHNFIAEVIAPTCTEQGYTTYTCACGDSNIDNYVEALGHSFGEWVVTKAATCTEKGIETRSCSRCDAIETRDINELPHSYTAEVIAPTCTEKGYTTYTCSACGDGYKDNYIEALGHSFGEWVVTKAATCTEKGIETRSCSRCDAIETHDINELPHSYIAEVTAPTCTEKGYTTYTCSVCGDAYKDNYIDALDHSFGEWVVTKAATCTEKGIDTRNCSRCDASETCEIEMSGHNYKAGECTVCGEIDPDFTPAVPAPTINIKTDSGKPTLKWAAVDGAEKYEVYRATSKTGTYTKYCTTSGTSYTNTTAVPGTTYYYKVKAIAANGNESDFSVIKSITCDCAQPVATISTVASSGKPTLKWNAVDGATKYEIWRATSSTGEYVKYYTTTNTSYTNTSAVAGYTYYYKVKAICGASSYGDSAFSAVKSITCDCAAPVATISTSAASGKPTLKWNAVDGATKYEIWRATSKDGEYVKYYTTTNTSYTNTSAVAGTTYYYKVKAICGKSSYGDSAFSAVKSITCDCAQPVVSITTSSGHPKLSWKAVDGADKYVIYRATSSGGTYTKMYTTTGTSYTNTTATAGTTYYYKVIAVSNVSTYADSAYSSIVSIKAK